MTKADRQEETDVKPLMDRHREERDAPHQWLIQKALRRSSLLLLYVDPGSSVAYYKLHLFTNYLLKSMTKDTMDSHIHGVLACSLKKEEHLTKKTDFFFNFANSQQGTMAWKKKVSFLINT